MRQITHFLPRSGPIPSALIAAILRDAQSGAQVQVVRARNILIGKDQSKCL